MAEYLLFFTRLECLVAQQVLLDLTCPLSKARGRGIVAIQALQGVSTGLAITACIMLERRFHAEMSQHMATFKLFSFKLVSFQTADQAARWHVGSAEALPGLSFPR